MDRVGVARPHDADPQGPYFPMQLLVFRHGIAESLSPDGSDVARRLTPEGMDKTRRAFRGLSMIAPPPRLLLSSPKVRARQTAELAADVFDLPVQFLPALAEEDPFAVLDHLASLDDVDVMVVGHEPSLSQMIEALCTAERSESFIRLKKAGCALLTIDHTARGLVGRGTLEWLVSPSLLRKLAQL